MLQAGKCIYQKNDPLFKVTTKYLYFAIKKPKPKHESAIRQLRLVKNIDSQRYQQLKRQLPYVVCAVFYPAVRLISNFAWTNHFMLDIDHLSKKEITPEQLKLKLKSDPRIELMFTSPGLDGLKILFRINQKLYDATKYSLFYRAFLLSFTKQYQLEQVADTRTSDVTRACFISHDPDAFYNSNSQPINPNQFIDFENQLEIKQLKSNFLKQEKNTNENIQKQSKTPIANEQLEKIKATLNPNFKSRKEKQIFVPKEVEQITQKVIDDMASIGIATTEVSKIHYGKKLKFALQNRKAEINLFYGKKGFSAVISPRNGTDKELNEICCQILKEWFE